jgi:transposase InsO family protein
VRAKHRNHVWSYDFVEDRTHEGHKYRMLTMVDEYTYECLGLPAGSGPSMSLTFSATRSFCRGIPRYIRSGNGPEFVAKAVRDWISAVRAKTACIAPGSPWENGHIESFDARLRDELLNGEICYSLREAKIVIESWRRHYNAVRPHASLAYRAPPPEVIILIPHPTTWLAAQPRPPSPAMLPLPHVPALN